MTEEEIGDLIRREIRTRGMTAAPLHAARAIHAAYAAEFAGVWEDNCALAAGQCIVDGGLIGHENGSQICALQTDNVALRARVAELEEMLPTLPIKELGKIYRLLSLRAFNPEPNHDRGPLTDDEPKLLI